MTTIDDSIVTGDEFRVRAAERFRSYERYSTMSVALIVGLIASVMGAALSSAIILRQMNVYATRNYATLMRNSEALMQNAVEIAAIKERLGSGGTTRN